MKRTMLLTAALIILALIISPAYAEWNNYYLPGGVCLESIVVDEPTYGLKGIWVIEKQAGAYWLPWSDQTYFQLSSYEEHDAYYSWFMGGDDKYGRVTGNTVRENRFSKIAEWKVVAKQKNNETIFKNNVTLLDNIDMIVAASESEREMVIQAFKKYGITKLPDGRSITSIVK